MSPRLAQLEKLLALDPHDPFTLYALAQEHAKAHDYAAAINFYDRTLAADAAYCYAYFHKARAQQAAGDLAGARLTVQDGIRAAHAASDGKAASELASLQTELIEAGGMA